MILKSHEAKYIKVRRDRMRMIQKPSSPFATYLIGKKEKDRIVVSTVRNRDETGRFLIGVDKKAEMRGGDPTLHDHIWTV